MISTALFLPSVTSRTLQVDPLIRSLSPTLNPTLSPVLLPTAAPPLSSLVCRVVSLALCSIVFDSARFEARLTTGAGHDTLTAVEMDKTAQYNDTV